MDTNFRCFEKNRVVELKVRGRVGRRLMPRMRGFFLLSFIDNECQHRITAHPQGMLEEVLRAEMLYHCRAIEILEPLCVSMRRLDPDRAMEVRGRN